MSVFLFLWYNLLKIKKDKANKLESLYFGLKIITVVFQNTKDKNKMLEENKNKINPKTKNNPTMGGIIKKERLIIKENSKINSIEKKELENSQNSISSKEESVENDFVNSALFFEEENDLPGKNLKEEPVIKESDTQDASEPEFSDNLINPNFKNENDEIFIKASDDKSKNYFAWTVTILILVLLILLGVFLFLSNKDKNITINNEETPTSDEIDNNFETEEIKIEDTLIDSQENIDNINATVSEPMEINVKIYNANGVAGSAGKTKGILTKQDYKNVLADNYSGENVVGTFVYYKEEILKEEAQKISDILSKNDIKNEIKVASTEEEKISDIVVILGK